MKISRIKINDFVGITELDWNPNENINMLIGPKGSGKSSVVEAIEKAFSNNSRRTEIIRHNSDEALIFIETDNELSIDRRLRKDKSDYLKLRKQGEGIRSTESELRQFLSGDIFRPLDFIDLSVDEQTEIILNMIEMDYSDKAIINWFNGEEELLSRINTDKHTLQILKDIEKKYYDQRTEVNREIKTLEAQIEGIEKELPDNYEGEKWEKEVLSDYYNKINKAQELNQKIDKAQSLIDNFEDKISAIKAKTKSEISEVKVKYQQEKEDIKDLIQANKDKIEQANNDINKLDVKLDMELKDIDNWLEKEIQKLKDEAAKKKKVAKETTNNNKNVKKNEIQQYKEKIASKKSELAGIDDKQQIEIDNIKKGMEAQIKQEENNVKTAKEFVEDNEKIEIEPLQEEAKKVEEMKSYLHDWRRMSRINEEELLPRKDKHGHLTDLIEIARDKPSELLKKHKLPISGISVDSEGRIRINGTLLDGLSSGEALENAFKIALERMGELRIICLDGIERLNETEQKKVVELCKEHDIQAFLTRTADTEDGKFKIENDIDTGLFKNKESE